MRLKLRDIFQKLVTTNLICYKLSLILLNHHILGHFGTDNLGS